uniref:Uncharacterized protein n=1 Tax=Anguilla anguilla TaxID=7936 RepID=A0A0E9VLK5_ANGAN
MLLIYIFNEKKGLEKSEGQNNTHDLCS